MGLGDKEQEAVAKPELDELLAVKLSDFGEASAWALLLECTVEQLQHAVAAVGGDPERIRNYLGNH